MRCAALQLLSVYSPGMQLPCSYGFLPKNKPEWNQ